MGSRAGSRRVRTGSRQPSSMVGGSTSSPCTHDRTDASADFDALVATIDLRPETAVDFPVPDVDLRLADQRLRASKFLDRVCRSIPATDTLGSRQRPARRQRVRPIPGLRGIRWRGDRLGAPISWPRRHRSRRGSRSMNGSTNLTSCLAAAVFLAASRQRSPSMGSPAGSRSVPNRNEAGSRQPSSPAGGSISSPCCHVAHVTPACSSTPGSPPSTCARRLPRRHSHGRQSPRNACALLRVGRSSRPLRSAEDERRGCRQRRVAFAAWRFLRSASFGLAVRRSSGSPKRAGLTGSGCSARSLVGTRRQAAMSTSSFSSTSSVACSISVVC